jgi:tetratricopeptide (TPR) repeat protein
MPNIVTDGQAAPPSKSRTRIVAVAGVVALLIGGVAGWQFWWRPELRADRLLTQARVFRSSRDYARAEEIAVAAMAINGAGDAGVVAAECAAEQGKYERAIQYLQRVTTAERRIRLRAAMLAARLNQHHLHRLSDAEKAYRDALEVAPDHIDANTELAKLLGLCGRKREAVPLVLHLIRLGVETDLLVLLAKESGVVHDSELLSLARQAAPSDPDMLMGLAWHAADSGRAEEAISFLREAVKRAPDLIPAHVALGQQLLAARQFPELNDWLDAIPTDAATLSETWFIRAGMAENVGDAPGAIRCFWEGLRLAPDSRTATAHMARLLAETGVPDLAEKYAEQLRRMHSLETVQNRVLLSANRDGVDGLVELARAYDAAGRVWEAYGWCSFATRLDESHSEGRRYLEQLQKRVRGMPLQLVSDSANVALSTDLSNYPIPRLPRNHLTPASIGADSKVALSFHDDAPTSGFAFRYYNGADRSTHRMYEFTGGGIGVVDYDRDGFADIFCTQGRAWPPEGIVGDDHDRLFRNLRGTQLQEIASLAGLQETGFGQGTAVGDFNSDGFPDIYVANIGANQLWANNGDGTFSDVTQIAEVDGSDWTTSCVLADLNGDGLPDIYAVNYVTADDVFDRVCRDNDGSPTICMPFDFRGQRDRLLLNDGDGHFTDATATSLSIEPAGMGLGVAVWDAHGDGYPSLFVANDTTPNFFFVNESRDGGPFRMRERGIEVGLALTGDGKATGCMGVALGDVNTDGYMDLNITNFLGESNTLYLSSSTVGFFEDQTQAMGLRLPTARVLGFGTQFLDIDLDGQFELFMTNGHIDDLTRKGRPYKMPPLLFRRQRDKFAEVPASELGSYFQRDWLGRSVVRLDWNRDGRDDLAIGHLYDPYALLTNTAPTGNHFLSVSLTGVQSNRDAIGTTVRARVGQRTLVRQVTAGDGYQASNQRHLIFGIGSAEKIDQLEVQWPAGTVQRFEQLPASTELLIIEGRRDCLTVQLPHQ